MNLLLDAAAMQETATRVEKGPPWPAGMRQPVKGDKIIVVHGPCTCEHKTLAAEVSGQVVSSMNMFGAWIGGCPVIGKPWHDFFSCTDDKDWWYFSDKRYDKRCVSLAQLDQDKMADVFESGGKRMKAVVKSSCYASDSSDDQKGTATELSGLPAKRRAAPDAALPTAAAPSPATAPPAAAPPAIAPPQADAPPQAAARLITVVQASPLDQSRRAIQHLKTTAPDVLNLLGHLRVRAVPNMPQYNLYSKSTYKILSDSKGSVWINLNGTPRGLHALFSHSDGTIFAVPSRYENQATLSSKLNECYRGANVCMEHMVLAMRHAVKNMQSAAVSTRVAGVEGFSGGATATTASNRTGSSLHGVAAQAATPAIAPAPASRPAASAAAPALPTQNDSSTSAQTKEDDIEHKLASLKNLFDKKLISESVYDARCTDLLKTFAM